MKEADIRKYAALMKELELTGLEIKDENRVVRLERSYPAVTDSVILRTSAAAPAPVAEPSANESIDNCTVMKSTLVGVFYAAPAENAEPFVSIGDRVEKGQTLCVIEAMKLMNEIVAEESGVIEKICVANGQIVEFGTELFRIRR